MWYKDSAVSFTRASNNLPVTLDEAKAHLRVLHDQENAKITMYIKAAKQWVESYTGLLLDSCAVTEIIRHAPPANEFFCLKKMPVTAFSSAKYLVDTEETAATVLAQINFQPARVYPTKDGYNLPSQCNGFKVSYTAGYLAVSDIPEDVKSAILLRIADLYENPVDSARQYQGAAELLLNPYRIIGT